MLFCCHGGGDVPGPSAKALEPKGPPLKVRHPVSGSALVVSAIPMWLPQVVPVVKAKKAPFAETMSGSGASRASAGAALGVTTTDGVAAGAGADMAPAVSTRTRVAATSRIPTTPPSEKGHFTGGFCVGNTGGGYSVR